MFIATRKQRLDYIADRLRLRKAAAHYGIPERTVTDYQLRRYLRPTRGDPQ